ncbi:tumor protein D53 homolog isoform X2 [Coregonus clupeaformis]|uniref:tumor protein D53 homolog isoform X2 n=1 Tax=Coregonus clupeaformis TaxID=59861 RepID=UPI001BDFAB11|nr:tumor protein D53 homolog isoform X2 [Coregonus clupeaformis]
METRQQERGQGHLRTGLLDPEPLTEVDEEMVSDVDLNNTMTDEEREEILSELTKLEEEISTLRQVLASKEKHHSELKAKLGITQLSELKQNFNKSWYDMQTSTAYKKTSETLSTAGQKTSAAFTTLGTAISRKFGDMRSNSLGYSIRHSMSMPAMRNSPSFKSFEEKVESTVSNIKTKVGSQGGGGSFEEVLSSAAHASGQETPSNNMSESSDHERSC